MEELTISFRFNDIIFNEISDLNEENKEKVQHAYQIWEKETRHHSAIHSLNKELNFDSSKIVNVSVETKKESPTITG
ncbi:hypothetical protein [Virgibacillus sp. DJP39]|uniref:hypothetical protein n=1 Tax=Virgibacillus sp. DJP39 TaxID=3409790 RepID=UPI003BB70284